MATPFTEVMACAAPVAEEVGPEPVVPNRGEMVGTTSSPLGAGLTLRPRPDAMVVAVLRSLLSLLLRCGGGVARCALSRVRGGE